MDDLFALNYRIATQLDVANGNVRSAATKTPVCLGRLKTDSEGLEAFLTSLPKERHENSIPDTSLNKEYLRFARQTARDVVSGGFCGLVVLNIDMPLARVLAGLTNQQINDLSFRWPGLILEAAEVATISVPEFHATAMLHYPAALIAA